MQEAKFSIGQIVHHQLFNYRGVIVDVDFSFLGSDEWYAQVARSRPPKDQPWYHILVDNATHQTYVAERNLEPSDNHAPINHPDVDFIFDTLKDDRYSLRMKKN
jgi:heat shock protein HspQ